MAEQLRATRVLRVPRGQTGQLTATLIPRGGVCNGIRAGRPSIAFRLHNYLPLFVSTINHGAVVADRHIEDHCPTHGGRALLAGSEVLGQDFRDQFRCGSGDRNPDGISVRYELVGIFEGRRRGNWADAGYGRHFFFLFGVELSGTVSVWREAQSRPAAL